MEKLEEMNAILKSRARSLRNSQHMSEAFVYDLSLDLSKKLSDSYPAESFYEQFSYNLKNWAKDKSCVFSESQKAVIQEVRDILDSFYKEVEVS